MEFTLLLWYCCVEPEAAKGRRSSGSGRGGGAPCLFAPIVDVGEDLVDEVLRPLHGLGRARDAQRLLCCLGVVLEL